MVLCYTSKSTAYFHFFLSNYLPGSNCDEFSNLLIIVHLMNRVDCPSTGQWEDFERQGDVKAEALSTNLDLKTNKGHIKPTFIWQISCKNHKNLYGF